MSGLINTHKLDSSVFNRLKHWSNSISGFYYSPTFLVGSALYKELYRDIDVICIIKDDWFKLRYGDVQTWIDEGETGLWTDVRWNWSKDCIHKWEKGCKQTNLNLDFKTIPESYFITGWINMPRLRLDDCKQIDINIIPELNGYA